MPAFYAFVNRKKAKELGVKINDIRSPYQLWNGPLPENAYSILLLYRTVKGQKIQNTTRNWQPTRILQYSESPAVTS